MKNKYKNFKKTKHVVTEYFSVEHNGGTTVVSREQTKDESHVIWDIIGSTSRDCPELSDDFIDDMNELSGVKDYNNYFSAQYAHANQIIGTKDLSKIDTLALITMTLSQYSDFHRSGNIY